MNVSKEVNLANTDPQSVTRNSKMKITTKNLIRWAGLSAMAAGTIFAVIQPIHPLDVLSSVTTNAWIIITSFKTVMSIFGLFGVAGLYARQVEKTGWLGFAGYLLMTVFYALQMCFSFTEPLILPLLATESPKFVSGFLGVVTGTPSEISLGAIPAVYGLLAVLYMLGTFLFGIGMLRARILSRWAAGLLAFAGPLSVIMKLLGHPLDRLAAVPMGIALAWLGYALFTERQAPASEPVFGKVSSELSQTGAD